MQTRAGAAGKSGTAPVAEGRMRRAWGFYRRSIAADENSSALQILLGAAWRVALGVLIGVRFVQSGSAGARLFYGFPLLILGGDLIRIALLGVRRRSTA